VALTPDVIAKQPTPSVDAQIDDAWRIYQGLLALDRNPVLWQIADDGDPLRHRERKALTPGHPRWAFAAC
jgi:hypothetical protein